jgi:hypothetical protein
LVALTGVASVPVAGDVRLLVVAFGSAEAAELVGRKELAVLHVLRYFHGHGWGRADDSATTCCVVVLG